MFNKRNKRIIGVCLDYLGGWLNLEMVTCEIDCELEFINLLFFVDINYIDYFFNKNLRKIKICY